MRTLILTALAAGTIVGPAMAQDSVTSASAASTDLGAASVHLADSGVRAAGGVSAVPFGLAGAVSTAGGASATAFGESATEAGEASLDAAGELATGAFGPLKVDDDIVVAPGPAPDTAMRGKTGQ